MTGQTELTLQSGPTRKRLGQARVKDRPESEEWLAVARNEVKGLARFTSGEFGYGYTFTAEQIRMVCGDPPHPNLMGALFNDPESLGIEFVGWVPSTRPEAHGRPLRSWRGR